MSGGELVVVRPPESAGPGPTDVSAWVKVQVFVSSMSIRYKIAGALIAVLCLAIASLGVVSFRQQKRTLQAETQRRAETIARQLASAGKAGLLTKDDVSVYSSIKDLEQMPDFVYALVQDNKGRVFAHSEVSRRGSVPSGPMDAAATASKELLFQRELRGDDPLLDASFPIYARSGAKTLRVGTARVGLSESGLLKAIRVQKLSFIGITSAFVLLGLVISFALGRLLTRQIIVLMTGMKIVSQGNLNQLVAIETKDEIGRLAESFNDMILNLREKLHMEKFLSQSTLSLIKRLRDNERMRLGGEWRHVTVLFSDIRGFTSMMESLDAEEVVGMLNIYLNLQAEVVHYRGGVVDKFVGDEVMALFTEKDAEYQAALAAQEIVNFVKSLNEARALAGKRQIQVGIGINNGQVIMANMGSERQMDYTAIGDPINIAARLCSAAKGGQTVLSRTVSKVVGERCVVRELPPAAAKGKKEPILVDELVDVPGAARRHMRRPLRGPARCLLPGLDEEHQVTLRDASGGGCAVETPVPLGIASRLRLSFTIDEVGDLEVEGTVRHAHKRDGRYIAGVSFEGLSTEQISRLIEWVHHIDTEIAAEGAPTRPEALPPHPPVHAA